MISGRGSRTATVGRGSISIVSVLLAFPKLLLLSSLGGAFFAPIGVVSSAARSAAGASTARPFRHNEGTAQSTTLTPPEPTNIFAAAGAENRIGAHPLDMAPDARASDGGEMDNPTQRVGAGGVDGMGIGAAEPHPPSTTLVHVKLAEPPSVWNLPNVITMARVVAIPIFATVFYAALPRRNVWCSAIFAGAALTDWLDGYIARKQGIVTPFGAFLDPVADKLMVSTALILLSQRLGPWMTICSIIILCRELTISALREWMAQLGLRETVKVGNAGKWKTATQMVAITLLLLLDPGAPVALVSVSAFMPLAKGLMYLSTVLTITSGSGYLSAAWPALMGRAKKDSPTSE